MGHFMKRRPAHYVSFSVRVLLAMMVVTVVVASVIGIALLELAIYLIQDMEGVLIQKNMEIVGENLRWTLDAADEFSVEISTSAYVRNVCREQSDEETTAQNTVALSDYLERQVMNSYENYGIHANFINIYLKNGNNFVQHDAMPYSDFTGCSRYYEDQDAIDGGRYTPMTWVSCIQLQDRSGRIINSLVWVRFIYDSVTMEKIGVMVGGVEEDAFKDIFSVFPHAYLGQRNGSILSATDRELFQTTIDAELGDMLWEFRDVISTVRWDAMNQRICFWKEAYYSVLLIVPTANVQMEMSDLTKWYTTLAVIFIAVGVLLGTLVNYFFTKSLSNSILSLRDTVQQVDEGNLTARYTVPRWRDEITYLGEYFNHMLDSLETFYISQEQEALARKNLEIQLLQSQINPHLLYNTLNSVTLAVRDNKADTAQALVYTLSNFVRLSLSNGRATVSLSTELNLLEKYILLQRLASHKDFQLEIDVPQELMSAVVIRTSLQPIVENSVIHGLSGYRDDGIIRIVARLIDDGKNLYLAIRDNGIGIEPDELNELNQTINRKDYKDMCSHFGLYNINWRIKFTWGVEPYGISVDSEVSDYTEVKMILPYIEGKKEMM